MFTSEFGSLWIDRADALQLVESKLLSNVNFQDFRSKIDFFIKNGYVIFESEVPHQVIDQYLHDFDNALTKDIGLLASVPAHGPQDKGIISATGSNRRAPLTKYLDTYWLISSALPIIFSTNISRFLSLIFEREPLAFQGLHFETGSTQAIHQDTAYVVSEKPLALAASWVALEDVAEGAGELIYYEGSHKLPDWKYSGKFKHFNHERDPHEQHLRHLEFLRSESERRGLPLKHFLPKKGDVLIWSADLAHGGAEISKPELSRKSLVTHYCPSGLRPHYFNYIDSSRQTVRTNSGIGLTSTFYY